MPKITRSVFRGKKLPISMEVSLWRKYGSGHCVQSACTSEFFRLNSAIKSILQIVRTVCLFVYTYVGVCACVCVHVGVVSPTKEKIDCVSKALRCLRGLIKRTLSACAKRVQQYFWDYKKMRLSC